MALHTFLMLRQRLRGRSPLLAILLVATLGVACQRKKEVRIPIETSPVSRRTIITEATASGAVEPINVIEVKSKSSGQITRMTVETGSLVRPGELLVQLDPRDVNQQLAQAKADLTAADARFDVAKAQRERNQKMFNEKIITQQEYEASLLDYANAEAAAIRARAAVDIAEQRVEDATVRAPAAGTVIEKTVSEGQVIASATNSASGGTILLKMANLTRVRVRANFNETDIGNVVPGQPATVTVDAYPDRPFRGVVEKIEPQAIVQQSVTMFPVLVTLDNLEGLLKPGMNGEVSVLVDRRENVLAVPNDAVRNTRDAASTARLLGLDPDSVVAAVQEQMTGGGRNGGGGNELMRGENGGGPAGNGAAAANPGARNESRGDVALSANAAVQDQERQGRQGRGSRQGGRQGFGQMPEVTDQDCQKVTTAFAAKPNATTTLQGLRGRMQAGEIDMPRMRAIQDSVYADLGVDAGVARACQFRNQGQRNASNGGQGASRGGAGTAQSTATPQNIPIPAGEIPMRGRSARPALVYVAEGAGYKPRVVRAGMADLDYTEIVSGLQEGERVVLLSALSMQASRDSALARMRQGMGGGVPGMQRNAQGSTPI